MCVSCFHLGTNKCIFCRTCWVLTTVQNNRITTCRINFKFVPNTCRLYHLSQVCKEPLRLNQTRPEREALIHLRRRNFSSATIRKDHKSLLKGRSSSLKKARNADEWRNSWTNILNKVHFPNVTAVDREHFPVPRCHNPLLIYFSIDKDVRKRVFLFVII